MYFPHCLHSLPLSISFSLFLAEAFSGPSNLQFSSQTSDSLRFRWTPAGGPVTGYVVQYTPLSGLGQPITAELRQVGTAGWGGCCSFLTQGMCSSSYYKCDPDSNSSL